MAANTYPIFELTPVAKGYQFGSPDSATVKALVTAGNNGTRIDSIVCSTTDTGNNYLAFYIYDTVSSFYIGNVLISGSAGYGSVPRVEAMSALLATGLNALVLPSGYQLRANNTATMMSGRATTVMVIGGDF